jgi:outer membrane autotransporter protein
VQVGGQRRVAEGWFVGGAVSYDDSSLSSKNATGSVSGHGASVGLVVKREVGNWLFSGSADFSHGSYDSVRNIAFGGMNARAAGSFDAQQFGLHSRIAYNLAQDSWYAKPYLDLHAVRLRTGGYTEQGAGVLGLAVSGASITTLSASPMVEFGSRVDLPNGMVARPYVAVGGMLHNRNEWGSDAALIGSMPGVAPFQATSLGPKKLAKLNLGVNLSVSKTTEVRLEYGGQFARGYRANQGTLRVNYLF